MENAMAAPNQTTFAGPTFYEFFAGGGMARAGLGQGWRCLFANDIDAMKARTYAANWGADHLVCGDVANLSIDDLPGRADLAWASFPCQDLSLAGKNRGLGTASSNVVTRSGTFWSFWALMRALQADSRAPRMIVLENVSGAMTSRQGQDFRAICEAVAGAGYIYGAIVVDAKDFLPQSRQRLFFVAVADDVALPHTLIDDRPSEHWHPAALRAAYAPLRDRAREQWAWWQMPSPTARQLALVDIIEERPTGCRWHSAAETDSLLAMMAPLHRAKIEQACRSGRKQVGGVYKRTRRDQLGLKWQRAEVRFDDMAGCLRTPAGGSSRQTIIVVEGDVIRSRLLSTREAVRLMGLDDDYKLPDRYNDAYHVAGDGVCVPLVRHLASHVLEPILASDRHQPENIAA